MKLERGLLLTFREKFGDIPIGNTQGKKMKPIDEMDFFTRRRSALFSISISRWDHRERLPMQPPQLAPVAGGYP